MTADDLIHEVNKLNDSAALDADHMVVVSLRKFVFVAVTSVPYIHFTHEPDGY